MYDLEQAMLQFSGDTEVINDMTEKFPQYNIGDAVSSGLDLQSIVDAINIKEQEQAAVQPVEVQTPPAVAQAPQEQPQSLQERFPGMNIQAAIDAGISESDIIAAAELKASQEVQATPPTTYQDLVSQPQNEVATETTTTRPGVLDAIFGGEGTTEESAQRHGYETPYDVTLGFGKFDPEGAKPITQMTIDEVYAHQQLMKQHPENRFPNGRGDMLPSSALGKYQIIEGTLRGLVAELGLSGDTIFTAEVQDQMGLALLNGRGYQDYLDGKLSARDFQRNVSREWASVVDPDTGTSHYSQHSGVTTEEFMAALEGGDIVSTILSTQRVPEEFRQLQLTPEQMVAQNTAQTEDDSYLGRVRENVNNTSIGLVLQSLAVGATGTASSMVRAQEMSETMAADNIANKAGGVPYRNWDEDVEAVESIISAQNLTGEAADEFRASEFAKMQTGEFKGPLAAEFYGNFESYADLQDLQQTVIDQAAANNEDVEKLASWIDGLVGEETQERVSEAQAGGLNPLDADVGHQDAFNTWIANIAPNVPRMSSLVLGPAAVLPMTAEMKGQYLLEMESLQEQTGVELDQNVVVDEALTYAIPAGLMEYVDNALDVALAKSGAGGVVSRKIKNLAGRIALKTAAAGTMEGMTEVSQGALMHYMAGRVAQKQGLSIEDTQRIVDAAEPDHKRAFIVGFGSGVVLGGAGTIAGETSALSENARLDLVEQVAAITEENFEAQAETMNEIIGSEQTETGVADETVTEEVTNEVQQPVLEEVVTDPIVEAKEEIQEVEEEQTVDETTPASEVAEQIETNNDIVEMLTSQEKVATGAMKDRITAQIDEIQSMNDELSHQMETAPVEETVAEEVVAEEVAEVTEEAAVEVEPVVLRDNDRVVVTRTGDSITKEFKDTDKTPTSAADRAASEVSFAKLLEGIAPKTTLVNETTVSQEFISGQELGENLTEQDVIDIANTLKLMHETGVVHQDLHMGIEDGVKSREGNIFRDEDGNIRIIDFEEAALDSDEFFQEFVEDEVEIFADDQIPADLQEAFLTAYNTEEATVEAVEETAKGAAEENTNEKENRKEKVPLTIPLKEKIKEKAKTKEDPVLSDNVSKQVTDGRYTPASVQELDNTQLSAQIKLATKDKRSKDNSLLRSEKARRGRQKAVGLKSDGKGGVSAKSQANEKISPIKAHVEVRKEARAVANEKVAELSAVFDENVDSYIEDNNRYVELQKGKGNLTDSEKVELKLLERDLRIQDAQQESELAADVNQGRARRKELKSKVDPTLDETIELAELNADALALTELRKGLPKKLRGERKEITQRIEEEKFSGMSENEFRLWLVDQMKVPPTVVKGIPTAAVKEIQGAVSKYSGMQGLKFRDNVLKPLTATLARELTGETTGLAESTAETRTVSLEQTGLSEVLGEIDENFGDFIDDEALLSQEEGLYDEENLDDDFDGGMGAYFGDGDSDLYLVNSESETTAADKALNKAYKETMKTINPIAPIAVTKSAQFKGFYNEVMAAIGSLANQSNSLKANEREQLKLLRNGLTKVQADVVAGRGTPIEVLKMILILSQNMRETKLHGHRLQELNKATYKFDAMVERLNNTKIDPTVSMRTEIEIQRQEGKLTEHEADMALGVLDAMGIDPTVALSMTTKSAYNFVKNIIKVTQVGNLAHESSHWAYHNVLSAKERYNYRKSLYEKYMNSSITNGLNQKEMEKNIQRSRTNNNSEQYLELGEAVNATYNASEFFAEQTGEAIYSGQYRANDTLVNKIRRFFKNLVNALFGKSYTDSFLRGYLDIIAGRGDILTQWQRKMRTTEGLNGYDMYTADVLKVEDYEVDAADLMLDVNDAEMNTEEMKVETELDEAAETVETDEIVEEDAKPKKKKKEQGEVSKRFSGAMRGAMMARDLQALEDGNLTVQQAQTVFIDYAIAFLDKGDLRKSLFRTVKNIKKVGDANWNHAAAVVGNIIEARNKSEQIVKIQKLNKMLKRRNLTAPAQKLYDTAVSGVAMKNLTVKTEQKLDDAIRVLTENEALVGISPTAKRKLTEAQARMEASPIQGMELDNLSAISSALANALAVDRMLKKELASRKQSRAERIRELAAEAGDSFETSGLMGKIREFEQNIGNQKVRNLVIEGRKSLQEVPLWDLNIEYMADMLGRTGEIIQETVIDPMVKAKEVANVWKYEGVDYFANVIEEAEIDISGWSSTEFSGLILGGLKNKDVKRVNIPLESKKTLTMTYDEAANILRVIRDEDGYRSLIESGIKEKQGRTQVDSWAITPNDIITIMQAIPEEVRNYAFGVGDKYFNEYEADKLNALGQETIGQDIAINDETYTHLNKDSDDVYVNDGQYSSVQEIINRNAHTSRTPGSLKERKEGATGAIVLEGMTEAVLRSAHEHGVFAGYSQTLGQVETATKEIAKELNKVGGEAVADKLSKKIASEMSSTSTSKYNSFEKKLKAVRGAYTVGKLGLRLGSALVQNTSILLYPTTVDNADTRMKLSATIPEAGVKSVARLVKNKFNVNEAFADMIEHSANMRERLEQGFAIDVTQSSNAADVKRFIHALTGDQRDNVTRFVHAMSPETAMGMIRMFDAKAMYEGWVLAQKQVEIETNLTEADGENYWDAVREVHNKFSRKTQPTFDSMDRTGLQEAPILKSIAMFASFRSKLWQVVRMGAHDIKTGNVRKGVETLATVVLLQLVSDMIKQAWKAAQGDDTPEDAEEWVIMELANILKSNIFFGDLVTGAIIPVLNDALGTDIKSYGDRSFITEVKEDLITTATHIAEGDFGRKSNREDLYKDLVKLSALAQIPVDGFMEYIDAIRNIKKELE